MSESKEEKTIGEIIAEARKNSGFSLRGLASRIEINYSYLADIEKSRRVPSEKILYALSLQKELKLDFDFLMAYSGRFGSESERYLKAHPKFGHLIRLITKNDLSDEQLNSLITTIENNYTK